MHVDHIIVANPIQFLGRNAFLHIGRDHIEHFGSKVYNSIIPRNVRLAEAPSYGKPVTAFDRQSRGAVAYMDLAQEILDRRDGVVRAPVEQGAGQ